MNGSRKKACTRIPPVLFLQLNLLLCLSSGACATATWHGVWREHPVWESKHRPVTGEARRDGGGLVFLRTSAESPNDRPEYVCLDKAAAARQGGDYSYTSVRIKAQGDCPPVESASELLVPMISTQKLLLPDLGISVDIPREDGASPYYTGPSLSARISRVTEVVRAAGGAIVLGDGSAQVVLKPACCAEKLAFYLSQDEVRSTQTVRFERIPAGSVVFAYAASDERLAYFIPGENAVAHFVLVDQELSKTKLWNLPVRGGLVVLFPVALAVDVVTSPLQMVLFAILANRFLEAVERFPRCLWQS